MVLLQVAAVAETLLVRNVPAVRTPFEQVVFITSGLTSILAFLLLGLAFVALIVLRKKAEELRVRLDGLLVEVKGMAEDSRETVRIANDRVRATVVNLTDRVDDLSGIISRVNDSAERVASIATTTVAGIKFGARAFGLTKKKRKEKQARKEEGEVEEVPRERPRLRRRD